MPPRLIRDSQAVSPFRVRWHSIANQATPCADIMSSPDPLNEPSSSPPRRVTRSQRIGSTAPSPAVAASPRKQRFELEVGDTRSPQRLWVTVETDENHQQVPAMLGRGARRKLFQPSSVEEGDTPKSAAGRRRAVAAATKTTTTVVPLRDEAEELAKTPRPRGRPRKSNGTPMPATAKKRKAATPAESGGRRRRRLVEEEEEQEQEQPPTKKKRGRPPGRSQLKSDAEATPRARITRQSQPPSTDEPSVAPPTADEPTVNDDMESDIWMATLSDDGAPVPSHPPRVVSSPRRHDAADAHDDQQARDEESVDADVHDIPSVSDTDDSSAPPPDDTVAQGEDFSIIFMDSIPSMQGFLGGNVPATAPEEMGEETSLIINNTLKALRQGTARDVEAKDVEPAREKVSPARAAGRVGGRVRKNVRSPMKRRRSVKSAIEPEGDKEDQEMGSEGDVLRDDTGDEAAEGRGATTTTAEDDTDIRLGDDDNDDNGTDKHGDEGEARLQQAEQDIGHVPPAEGLGSSASSTCLPTPDDTPPQTDEQQAPSVSEKEAMMDLDVETAATSTSIPRPPSASPPKQQHEPSWLEKTVRPGLSAMMRAGRALQNMASPDPSSVGRQKQQPQQRDSSPLARDVSRTADVERQQQQQQQQPDDGDDDDSSESDIWEREARRGMTPRAPRQQPFGRRATVVSRNTGPGRAAAEKRTDPNPEPDSEPEEEEEEYSQVLQRKQAEQRPPPPPTPRARGLASFFSSPVVLPDMTAAAVPEVKAAAAPAPPQPPPPPPPPSQLQPRLPRTSLATNSMFPQPPTEATTTMTTPTRTLLSHADIHRWQRQTTSSPPPPPRSFLRPLPPKNASPTKSSMRSPLKPRTPGRVVEFTSSVLSAPVREEEGDEEGDEAEDHDDNHHRSNNDNINDNNNETNVTNAPDKEAPQPWSRTHWLLLDSLLQRRRQGPFATAYARRADDLLGKTVQSQGVAMRLRRWHLDCVDAFCAEAAAAPPCDLDPCVLAKRLFSLIAGEEKRRRCGIGERGRERESEGGRRMFH
ncbi:hypothetical protein CP532_2837 [Ophiocordyceps camponoti-leonardi (nom. inval.)]|nr:hypothetical protein CP532_2837 [Ophiocordyceps camponoti-leonardi (nom. inval.)]